MEFYLNHDFESWLSALPKKESENQINKVQPKKKYTLDLFKEILPAIDSGNKNYYRSLSEEQQKEIDPWVLMRWLSSSEYNKDLEKDLINVNYFVNDKFNDLSSKKVIGSIGHKELQWMLLTLCGRNKNIRRKFLKPPRGFVRDRLEDEILKLNPLMKTKDINLFLKVTTEEQLIAYLKNNGYDEESITKLLENYEQSR